MLFFNVRCKNPKCDAFPPTPYYTYYDTPEEIKRAMDGCLPTPIACPQCKQIFTYNREDLGVFGHKKQNPSPEEVRTEETSKTPNP
jgi:hypothetical protein